MWKLANVRFVFERKELLCLSLFFFFLGFIYRIVSVTNQKFYSFFTVFFCLKHCFMQMVTCTFCIWEKRFFVGFVFVFFLGFHVPVLRWCLCNSLNSLFFLFIFFFSSFSLFLGELYEHLENILVVVKAKVCVCLLVIIQNRAGIFNL